MDITVLVELDHLLQAIPRSIQHTFQRNIPAQCQDVSIHSITRRILFTGEVADARDHAAKRHAVEALAKRLRGAVLEDNVGSVAVGELEDFVLPVWICAVIDHAVCTEGFGLLELGVRRACYDC